MPTSTESDEPLMGNVGNEKQWSSSELDTELFSRTSNYSKAFVAYRWFIDAFLVLVIVGLLLLLQYPASSRQVGGDFTETSIPTKSMKFESDMSFVPKNTSEFFADETLARWKTLLPVGASPGPIGQTFSTTSMTHQLHCIYMMGRIFSGVVSNVTHLLPEDYHSHFLHCVDYVRQGIMCSGDMALEAHDPMDSDDLGPLDGGWSGQHICKDYSQVLSYLEGQIEDGVRVVLPIDD